MAAKLEWKGFDLNLGPFNLAYVYSGRDDAWRMTLLPVHGKQPCEEVPYERAEDCRQDCESEVRRLLKAAGVEVAP